MTFQVDANIASKFPHLARVVARVESRGYVVDQLLHARTKLENIPCGRSSCIVTQTYRSVIEFVSDSDDQVFGSVTVWTVVENFDRRNPHDRSKWSTRSSFTLEADDETKKLLDWKA